MPCLLALVDGLSILGDLSDVLGLCGSCLAFLLSLFCCACFLLSSLSWRQVFSYHDTSELCHCLCRDKVAIIQQEFSLLYSHFSVDTTMQTACYWQNVLIL